jgi:hypothetical protein
MLAGQLDVTRVDCSHGQVPVCPDSRRDETRLLGRLLRSEDQVPGFGEPTV